MYFDPNVRFLVFHFFDDPVDRIHMVPEFLRVPSLPVFAFITNTESANQGANLPQKSHNCYMNFRSSKLSLNPVSYFPIFSEFKPQGLTVFMRICGKADRISFGAVLDSFKAPMPIRCELLRKCSECMKLIWTSQLTRIVNRYAQSHSPVDNRN